MARVLVRSGTSLLPVLIICFLVNACGEDAEPVSGAGAATDPTPEGEPSRGDWLVLHMLSDPENLNPLTSNDSGASRVLSWIFPSLLRLDERSLEMVPFIASELPKISEDRLSYTFRIRSGVTFSDGTPLTTEDVVFAMKATKHPRVNAPHARNYYEKVREVVALDRTTVRFSMSEPYFRNIYSLGSVSPLPRHYYDPENLLDGILVAELDEYDQLDPARKERADRFAESFNKNYQRNPLGPGAYVLRDPERDLVTGEKITLRHRDDYWATGDPKLGDGFVDRIVFRIVNDPEAALVAFKARELDSMSLRPIQHLRATSSARFQKQADKHVEVLGSFMYIGWNQKKAVFQDRRVRRALTHLVDKKNIIDKVLLGFGVPIESPIFVKRPEHNDRLEPYEFDPKRARELL
ncbi:MAG: ABC transporter substrate-binding protein, partial [Myxococcota bacterium]